METHSQKQNKSVPLLKLIPKNRTLLFCFWEWV